MGTHGQSRDELLVHLNEQMDFLRAHAEQYDRGSPHFAKPLAAVLRTLLHKTAQSHALLDQLGVLDQMEFIDSGGEIHPATFFESPALCSMRLSPSGMQHIPIGPYTPPVAGQHVSPSGDTAEFQRVRGREQSQAGAWQPFDQWWRELVIVRDRDGTEFTRRDLVLFLANKDGGSHVDPHLAEAFAGLSRFGSLGWVEVGPHTPPEGQPWLDNPIPPSVRQIAWEVQHTLTSRWGSIA